MSNFFKAFFWLFPDKDVDDDERLHFYSWLGNCCDPSVEFVQRRSQRCRVTRNVAREEGIYLRSTKKFHRVQHNGRYFLYQKYHQARPQKVPTLGVPPSTTQPNEGKRKFQYFDFLHRFHKGDKRSYKLTEEDVVFLASHTNYTQEEIREWFRSMSRTLFLIAA